MQNRRVRTKAASTPNSVAPSRAPKQSVSSNTQHVKALDDPYCRAEDVILGSLGFGEDASITSIRKNAEGYEGKGQFSDGEEFTFQSDDLDDLSQWALSILLPRYRA